MRLVKLLIVLTLALAVSGCACRTKKVGSNIPVAEGEGPLKDVHFGFDRYDLDSAARAKLDVNAEWLLANPESKVQVEGHCDERGTNEYNLALGWKRARTSHDYLVSKGVPASRMATVSYGEELPLDPRHNEEAWAKNRRTHFSVQK